MGNSLNHLETFSEWMMDLAEDGFANLAQSAGVEPLPEDNFLGIFPRGEGPLNSDGTPAQPAADPDAPAWFLLWDLGEPLITATFADGQRGREYMTTFDFFADPERCFDVFRRGAQMLKVYLERRAVAGWTIMEDDEEVLPGVEQNGGFDGRSIRWPMHAS